VSAEVELRMLKGSEFQTVGAAILKPRVAKVVRGHVEPTEKNTCDLEVG